jgi:hypothetical protein
MAYRILLCIVTSTVTWDDNSLNFFFTSSTEGFGVFLFFYVNKKSKRGEGQGRDEMREGQGRAQGRITGMREGWRRGGLREGRGEERRGQ